MNRRAFLGTLTGGLLAAPLATEAQPTARRYRIGALSTYSPGPQDPHWASFVQGMRALGYIEGHNLHIEHRLSEGHAERLPALAAELVQLGVSVIVASAPGPSRAAKQATTTVPIVFVGVADPVGFGLVASLARPGGNVTGLASIEWEAFTAKQVQVIKEAFPNASRVTILVNPTNQMHPLMVPQAQAAADRLSIKLQLVEARHVDDLESVFATAQRGHADVVHVFGDSLVFVQRARVAELALKHRLPTMHFFPEAVEAGGLLSFGPDWVALYRNAGNVVDKILKGTKPADIPVAQPTKYALIVNLKTAKALGLTIPPSLLQRADRVIE
jgi:putative ABC transport system substrate-binding protein